MIELHAALEGLTIDEAERQLAGRSASEARHEVAVYDYQDVTGKIVFQVVRYSDKSFPQRRPLNGKWVWNMRAQPRP